MKQLSVKREVFLQAFIKCGNASEAYRTAFNAANMKAETVHRKAAELMKDGKVTARLAELQAAIQKRHEVTADRVIAELAKIGFSDMRKALKWGPFRKEEEAEDGSKIVTVGNDVVLVPSEELDDLTAACISEVAQTAQGVKIKFHDKRAALVDLGKVLGVFEKDNQQQGDAMAKAMAEGAVNDRAIARAILDIFRTAKVENGTEKTA